MGRKRLVYDPSSEIHPSQLIRRNPSFEKLRTYQKERAKSYANDYINFLNHCKIAPDVVDEVWKMSKESGFGSRKNDIYMTDKERTAFALVRFGKKPIKEGLRILYSHCDSPCLQAKTKPLLFEWDPDLKELHLGVEIDTHGYGGILPHQWTGKDLLAFGWSYINGKRKKYSFPVYSSDRAQHTEPTEGRVHKEEFIDLVTGHSSRKDLLKEMGLNGEWDFARTRLYFVPDVTAKCFFKDGGKRKKANKKLNRYLISGYGQDDRIGVFSSVKALTEINNPKYTTIVIGFDKEEVGSGGLAGAKGKFFERVLNKTLIVGDKRNLENITVALREDLYEKSLAIDADCDVGSTHREEEVTDKRNIAKLGCGVFISGTDGYWEGDQVSPWVVDRIMTSIQRRNVIFQTIGNPLHADEGEVPSMNEFFVDRGIPTLNVCAPLGSLHSPVEVSHMGDLYSTIQAYKAFIEEPVRKSKKRG